MIIIEHLSKKYKTAENYSVSNLSLFIAEKEIFGLLGPNGAGKTTLISLLCSLIKPTSCLLYTSDAADEVSPV